MIYEKIKGIMEEKEQGIARSWDTHEEDLGRDWRWKIQVKESKKMEL